MLKSGPKERAPIQMTVVVLEIVRLPTKAEPLALVSPGAARGGKRAVRGVIDGKGRVFGIAAGAAGLNSKRSVENTVGGCGEFVDDKVIRGRGCWRGLAAGPGPQGGNISARPLDGVIFRNSSA